MASWRRDAERRSPFHFLALALPGFAAIRTAKGSKMSAAEVAGERSRARLGSGRGTGSETAIGSARAQRSPREVPGVGDPRRERAVLGLRDARFRNLDSGSQDQLGGDCGTRLGRCPAPPPPSWRWVLRPWADREPGRKELATKGLPWRSDVARGEPCVREKPPGKLRCKGHFLASTRPVPSEAGFSGFGDRVRCAGRRARGWASCFLRIRGHRTSPPSLPHKHPFLVGEQSRCSLPRELGPPRERRRAPVLRLGRDFSF